MLKRRMTIAAILAAGIALTGSASFAGDVEPLTTVRVANLLAKPVGVTHAPGDYTRLYIIEKRGKIKILNIATGVVSVTPFLDIDSIVGGSGSTNSEQGLLGIAFHPDWQNNRFVYVNYTNNSGNTVVARYTATSPDLANPSTAFTIISYNQPFANHNGGWIGFAPNNGYLYISTGDGGSANDPGNRGQDITNQRLGKMLRLDVDGDTPYAIPPGNPFVDITGDDEIWAYGLRNPWRCSFDRMNGDLYIADVGQNAREEINHQRGVAPGGTNYGWRCYEGNNAFILGGCSPASTMTFPFHEYTHSTGFSITGGYNYRGCDIPTLTNTYFFADYATERIWSMNGGGGTANFTERTSELDPPGSNIDQIASFGEDMRGELYIVDQVGEIFRITPVTPTIKRSDFNCDGTVGFTELLQILALWGPCDGCLEDLDGDHAIGFNDLVKLLAEWG